MWKPDLASSTKRVVTAWAQWIPKAATRWESYLEGVSIVASLLCTVQDRFCCVNKSGKIFYSLIMPLYLGKNSEEFHFGYEISLGLSLQQEFEKVLPVTYMYLKQTYISGTKKTINSCKSNNFRGCDFLLNEWNMPTQSLLFMTPLLMFPERNKPVIVHIKGKTNSANICNYSEEG